MRQDLPDFETRHFTRRAILTTDRDGNPRELSLTWQLAGDRNRAKFSARIADHGDGWQADISHYSGGMNSAKEVRQYVELLTDVERQTFAPRLTIERAADEAANGPRVFFEVQTWTHGDGWQNVWQEDGEPLVFHSMKGAQAALDEFFEDLTEAGMADKYSREDYRLARVEIFGRR
jgi:hypothetical protein